MNTEEGGREGSVWAVVWGKELAGMQGEPLGPAC